MVDSSVRGKTGVDTPLGKNLVGAFHPPAAVLDDPLVLQSLPPQHLRGGLAEMAKHGLIADAGYWRDLGAHASALEAREPEALTRFIARSVEIKADVVMEDEREAGRRAALNAGHTVAHAVEHASGFDVSHGDAVAMGLVAEATLAEALGIGVPGLADRVSAGLRRLSLPTRLPVDIDANRLYEAMRLDKKRLRTFVAVCLLTAASVHGFDTPSRDKILRVHGRFGAGHACPISPRVALTAAHVVDVQPFDADAGLLSGRFEDVAGTVSGRYTPVYALTSEDLAVITTDVDTPFYTVASASAAPKPGDQLFWVAYNFNAKKRAYEPLPLDGRVISVVAGMVIVDTRTPPGSSGSCVLNAEGQMKEQATRHLAVTQDGQIIGVISVSNILRYYSGVV